MIRSMRFTSCFALVALLALVGASTDATADAVLYDDDPGPNMQLAPGSITEVEVTSPVFEGTESFGALVPSGFNSIGLAQTGGGPIITTGNTTLLMHLYLVSGTELAEISLQLAADTLDDGVDSAFQTVAFQTSADPITIDGVARGVRADDGALPTGQWLRVELDLAVAFANIGIANIEGLPINRLDVKSRFSDVEVYVDDVRLIPEPASLLLLVTGGMALVCRRHH